MIVQTGRYMFYIAYRWLHKLLIRKKKRTFFALFFFFFISIQLYIQKKAGENLSINFFVTFDGENCVSDWIVVCMFKSLDRLHTNANWWFADDVDISCDTLANIKITQIEICIQAKPTVNFRLVNMPNTCACVYIQIERHCSDIFFSIVSMYLEEIEAKKRIWFIYKFRRRVSIFVIHIKYARAVY